MRFAIRDLGGGDIDSMEGEEIQLRMTSMWTTTSLVGAILGAAGFEGLWLRPSSASGATVEDDKSLVIYGIAIYLSVRFRGWHPSPSPPGVTVCGSSCSC